MKNLLLLLSIVIFAASCGQNEDKKTEHTLNAKYVVNKKDHHSFADLEKARTKHLNLDINIDFEKKKVSGKAAFDIVNNNSNKIVLDTRFLTIEKVTIGKDEQETTYKLLPFVKILGQALEIDIKPTTDFITVYYSTQPENPGALDWANPMQTYDKKFPFLFTQGQAILTRTWIPCQDSPGNRITYNATVKVPKHLMAVMSASNTQEKTPNGIYEFSMKQPIPPYLIAMAVGDLEFAKIGNRSGVYAEPGMLPKAAYEFGEVEKMIEAAEKLYGPYAWDRYDMIVLPPSFPFGGMENPRLTFTTPTIIAGDRSLTTLIAHELAHSWSGNLVTNATWDDFWLNEGFTVYFEHRIMESIYGEDFSDMVAVIGQQDLAHGLADFGKNNPDTKLKLNLKGRDPDDGMTDIAYEKGCAFLTSLEKAVGRDKFDVFIKGYFAKYKFQTLTTEEFIPYLEDNLLKPNHIDFNHEEWIYGTDLPDNYHVFNSKRFAAVDVAIEAIDKDPKALPNNTSEWVSHEWLHFIRHLPKDNINLIQDLDKKFKFSDSGNQQLLSAWYELAVRTGYSKQILPKIEQYLTTVGRRWLIELIYRAFKETDQLETAKNIYKKARPNYHSVSRGTMDSLLG